MSSWSFFAMATNPCWFAGRSTRETSSISSWLSRFTIRPMSILSVAAAACAAVVLPPDTPSGDASPAAHAVLEAAAAWRPGRGTSTGAASACSCRRWPAAVRARLQLGSVEPPAACLNTTSTFSPCLPVRGTPWVVGPRRIGLAPSSSAAPRERRRVPRQSATGRCLGSRAGRLCTAAGGAVPVELERGGPAAATVAVVHVDQGVGACRRGGRWGPGPARWSPGRLDGDARRP